MSDVRWFADVVVVLGQGQVNGVPISAANSPHCVNGVSFCEVLAAPGWGIAVECSDSADLFLIAVFPMEEMN